MGTSYEATIHDCNKIISSQKSAITGRETDMLLRHSTAVVDVAS